MSVRSPWVEADVSKNVTESLFFGLVMVIGPEESMSDSILEGFLQVDLSISEVEQTLGVHVSLHPFLPVLC